MIHDTSAITVNSKFPLIKYGLIMYYFFRKMQIKVGK